jgi:uridine kinase
MNDIPNELIEDIASIKPQTVLFIAIDGCGGAGKSTYASKLALALGNSQVIHIDDFYKPKEKRIKITEQISVHSNFEFKRLEQQVLEPLKHGNAVTYLATNGKKVVIKPEGYVLVEGLGTLGMELKNYFDYKIWIDSPEAIRRRRGIERDSEEWTKIWDEEYLPQDARYVKEHKPYQGADWILNNC